MRASKLASLANRNPLVKSLPTILGDSKPARRRPKKGGKGPAKPAGGTIKRVDIVSESLCDDVIKYLQPTLEQHKGCTLIDFEPGPCLFSSKLHDFLKPKRHFLIEPEKVYFEPFIKPLLSLPGSTYRHSSIPSVTHPSLRWDHQIRTKYDQNLLPERKLLPADDARRLQFDPSVLVIGNLARRAGQRRVAVHDHKFDLQRLVLFAMAKDLLSKSGFFEAGLVRMLWWVPDAGKAALMPSNVPNNRSAFGLGLDMAFDVSEVTGVIPLSSYLDTRSHHQRKRLSELEALASSRVAERMREASISVPENRLLQVQPSEIEGRTGGVEKTDVLDPIESMSPFQSVAEDASALDERIDSVSTRITELSEWAATFRVSRVRQEDVIQKALNTLQYPQCKAVPASLKTTAEKQDDELRGARNVVLMDLGLRILNVEAGLQALSDKATEKQTFDKLKERVLFLDKQFRKMLHKGGERVARDVSELIEDQLAFYSSSPLMAWDRRAYEPLLAKSSDFHPKTDIALIDFMPKAVDLAVPDLADSRESAKVCSQLLTSLLATQKQPLPIVLDRIAVNASKDLIPQVPAITDARRGGRLNPVNLKSRMLTTEMVEGLVKAWFEWPFRPQSWELSLVTGEAEGVDEARETEVEESGT